MVLGKGVAALRYKETLRKVLKDLAIAVFGWVAASVHLRLFDPLFLRRGRIRRIL
jgi:hypothetical protein